MFGGEMTQDNMLFVVGLACLLLLLACLALQIWILVRTGRSPESALIRSELTSAFERLARQSSEGIRQSQAELYHQLRTLIAEGTAESLQAAFNLVKEGASANTSELVRFGSVLKEDVNLVRTEITALAERTTSALTAISSLLGQRLSAAEMGAADGRAILLRDTAAAILQSREQTDSSLRRFGEQQGQSLESIVLTVRHGGETAQANLADFRKDITERLDAGRTASTDLLKRSAETFNNITSAVAAFEEKTASLLGEQNVAVLGRLAAGQQEVSDRIGKNLGELTRRITEDLQGFSAGMRQEQEQLRGLVGAKLDELRAGNETKLEDMRRAVDEKLQGALEKQVGESFQRIAEQFAAVQQAIGQVQSVAGQVGDLRRLFSNVKSRGGWGEAQAEAMLQDMLPTGAYEKNMRMREGTAEHVEFAIRIPGKDESPRWIPIDSKFPTEDYEKLLSAHEAGDRVEEASARAGLERRIRQEAERIGSKYIVSPKTVDFAVLYLPSDSLFAEIARLPGLIERVRREHKIMVMGPSLLPAFLHTVNVGYMTLAIERNATEIGETLGAVKAEWSKLLPWLDKIADRTDTLKKGIEAVQQRARAVGRKLRTVDVIDHARAEAVLGLDDAQVLDDNFEEGIDSTVDTLD